jgi:XTP/dITP diphosphohydrolase
MTNEFVFATNNLHKLEEVREIANGKFIITCLSDLGHYTDLPEDQTTLEGNSLQKARFISEKFEKNCFADDTGLEVEALNGEPGVYSARYAGEGKSAEENIKKLLSELRDCPNRNARFRTVIALVLDDKEYFFEGVVDGIIINEGRGQNGFGYDPVFIPNGFDETFAELPLDIKNRISHRALAIEKLFYFLRHHQE